MIEDLGFIVEGADEKTLPLDRDEVARGDVKLRKRGAGTELPANA